MKNAARTRAKDLRSGTDQARQLRLEAELDAWVRALFRHLPTLQGFTVGREAALADVSDLAWFGAPPEVRDAIGAALRDLVEERPEAEALLRDRTFARALH